MSKKMKIPSIFKITTLEAKQPWQWPSCNNPKTLSFRASNDGNIFKTINSVFLDISDGVENPESWFTNSRECASFSTDEISDDNNNNTNTDTSTDALETIIQEVKSSERLFFKPGDTSSISEYDNNTSVDAVEVIIQGVKSSERLFFEPGTSSILKDAKTSTGHDDLPFKESVALALESDDPYLDFKKSMQEMVESYGLKDWDCLEELLGWYLKMNGKMNHGFIVGAFVDLLIGLASNNSTTSDPLATPSARVCSSDQSTSSYSSADSSFSSSPSSPLSPALVVAGHEKNIATDERDVIVQGRP